VIGGVVGTLMDHLHEVDPEIPLINVLVVNQNTGLPGVGVNGYLRSRYKLRTRRLADDLRDDLIARAAREVYAYPSWAKVYRDVFGGVAPIVDPTVLVVGTEVDGLPASAIGKRGGEAESKEHKALKAYMLANPDSIGLKSKPDRAAAEFSLMSGDEVDVFFQTGSRVDVVEVKSILSNWTDLRRGIYQCIKYKAVFEAQSQLVTPDMQVVATLVLGSNAPADICALVKLHKIRLKTVNVKRRPRR
jgi:hypothetical protein